MSNSGLTPYQDEVLTILNEECGEVVQEICKIMRFGINSRHYHHNNIHWENLEQELGDILACIDMVKHANIGITEDGLEAAKQRKLEKVVKWMKHMPPQEVALDQTWI